MKVVEIRRRGQKRESKAARKGHSVAVLLARVVEDPTEKGQSGVVCLARDVEDLHKKVIRGL